MAKEHEILTAVDAPRMVGSHSVQLDEEYALWMADLKNRYRKAQVRAAIKVMQNSCCSIGSWVGTWF